MTTNVLNTKISEVKIEICNVSGLVEKADYDAKMLDVERKDIITPDYNKFMSDRLDARVKQEELVNNSGIS